MDRKYEHFGEIIDRVDERGEVALLTRNIVIEGEMASHCPTSNGNCNKYSTDTFGGHFKARTCYLYFHFAVVVCLNFKLQKGAHQCRLMLLLSLLNNNNNNNIIIIVP